MAATAARTARSAAVAVNEVRSFHRNYHSRRFVGSRLIVRLRAAPTDDEIAALNEEFADIVNEGRIERTETLPVEVETDDLPELPRLMMRFDRSGHGRFRQFIDALNNLASAPPLD